jgi:hypothetical protein
MLAWANSKLPAAPLQSSCWPTRSHRHCICIERLGQLEAIGSTTSKLLLANKESSALHMQRVARPTRSNRQHRFKSPVGQQEVIGIASAERGWANFDAIGSTASKLLLANKKSSAASMTRKSDKQSDAIGSVSVKAFGRTVFK